MIQEEYIEKTYREAIKKIENTRLVTDLELVRVFYLGRKSEFNIFLKNIKNLSPEEKKEIGPKANSIKQEIQNAIIKKHYQIERESFDYEKEYIDVTIPGKKILRGNTNILTKVQDEIARIFTQMGFEIADGPEIESEFYNFDALNIPKNHPARDMWDTFWIKAGNKDDPKKHFALRPHTSPVQIRYMENHVPPYRIIVPGKVFRNEATDASHEHSFYQFEALVVGEKINIGNFKYISETFFSNFFRKKIKIQLRPSFFPFVEPGFEFDVSCIICDGSGCSTCSHTGWLEVGGAGMVNQNVFVASGYERNKYQGFAWGFGIERLTMMKYKIDDIRVFRSGDIRFVEKF